MSLATVRLMTRAGAWLTQRARKMAQGLNGPGPAETRHAMIDGFLLKARRLKDLRSAFVLDMQGYVLMPGFNKISNQLTIFMPAVPVGTRDDFLPQDAGAQYETVSAPGRYLSYLLQPVSSPTNLGGVVDIEPALSHAFQDGPLFGYGYFIAGLAEPAFDTSFYALDDMSHFTFAQTCAVGGGMTAAYSAGVSLGFTEDGAPSAGGTRDTYLNGAGMWLTEDDLAPGWYLHPRRQVSHLTYSTLDGYRSRSMFGLMNPGYLFTPAEGMMLEGVDTYCVAARVFRQHIGTFFNVAPGASYRPPYYDREGEQALIIAIGSFDRGSYTPGGPQAAAAIDSVRYVLPSELPLVALRPYPPTIPGNPWGRPDLPGIGRFVTPWVGRTHMGYVVFSGYTTYRDLSDGTEETEGWVGDANGIIVSLPNGTDEILVADWDSGDGAPLIPGASSGVLVVSYIIGGAIVPRQVGVEPDQEIRDEAYCFVWEHLYARKGAGADRRGIGGRLVVYSVRGLTVERSVVTSSYAPLFASMLSLKPVQLVQVSTSLDTNNMLANAVWVGGNRIALPVVSTPVAMPASGSTFTVPEHEVFALIYDVDAGTFTVTDSIFSRTDIRRKCLLSAARVEITTEEAELPAALLASVTTAVIGNRGAGKVYIRRANSSGAMEWNEYISDLGGQGGAFYVGNKFWWHDNTKPMTIGELI